MSRNTSRQAGRARRSATATSSEPAATEAPRTELRELSWQAFDALALELARGLSPEFEPDLVVGVAKGGVFVGGAVASVLRRDFYPVRISRRSRERLVRAEPKAFTAMPRELKGKRVLIVDDVAASGDTLDLARRLARGAGARQVKTAALVVRRGRHRPDFYAMETDALVVFPWDYDFVAGGVEGEEVE